MKDMNFKFIYMTFPLEVTSSSHNALRYFKRADSLSYNIPCISSS